MSSSKDDLATLQKGLAQPNPSAELARRMLRIELDQAKIKAALAEAAPGHYGRKKAKTLTHRQINALLSSARREQSPLDWSVLSENQEICARLRWQCRLSVSLIARSLGKHRKSVEEVLHRAKAKLDRAGHIEKGKKRQAIGNLGY